MALCHRMACILYTFVWLLFAPYTRAQQPVSQVNFFQNFPARLFFFDDTTTIIYHDIVEGNIYISPDEGMTWSLAADIPSGEAAMVIEHPVDRNYAFVLTKSTTHYRTSNRGRSWQSFSMPIQPALVSKPLSFHSDPTKYGYVLYQGTRCDRTGGGWGAVCHDETWYTKDAFSDSPQLLLSETSRCQFAHSSKDFKHESHSDLIYCVAFDSTSATGGHSLSSSRLFSSTDFFREEMKVEDLGIGKNARGVLAFAIVSKFAVVAMKDLAPGTTNEMILYVTVDTKTWAKAQFPHASTAKLRENAYTIVESTTHSLAVDVLLQDQSAIGTLFVSNSNGTFFVEALKDTNRNELGFVDYENLYGIEGVGLANVVMNAEDVEGRRSPKQLQTKVTFDDGRTWSRLIPPRYNSDNRQIMCNPSDDACSLHLHSVTAPHNLGRVFSSPAPGFVIGVGSVGGYLQPYEDCDTFLSTDAGVTWKMVRRNAHKYEFGDQGSIMVLINDEEAVDTVTYSSDLGDTWQTYNFGISLRAKILTTVPDSTSQKFVLVGQISRTDQRPGQGRYAVVYLDFANIRPRQCGDNDFEQWYARTNRHDCLMGHKQWYRRRKPTANCFVGQIFEDPVGHEESCPCEDFDYECDYNYVREGDLCVPVGPEPIPAGVCSSEDPSQTYLGSSGWRLIPGNTCDRLNGVRKDEPVEKSCSQAQPQEGEISHQIFEFSAPITQYAYFKGSTTVLVRLGDNSVWQSSNEGYTWQQIHSEERFVAFYHHAFSNDRAYLLTNSRKYYYTTDTGRSWHSLEAPTAPNSFNLQVIHFHPTKSDFLIWNGDQGCDGYGESCHIEAHYSRDNGRNWGLIDDYVRNCAWARDAELRVDATQIICESYRIKQGSQRTFGINNPLELISGTNFFRERSKLFDHVIGFAKFAEFLIVAEYVPGQQSLDLQVSLDGRAFATGMFPPTMRPDQHAYTILESSTKAIFLHVTVSEPPHPWWGNILKSNSNGTYFGLSIDHVNRNTDGYVDFEKMVGLDGIALINIISNPDEATLTGYKELQSRITHNDGGTWKRLNPPLVDSQGNGYPCNTAACSLHVHGYTERFDSRATYSTPSVPGLLMAVGNVGEKLAEYTESDTFLSRDAGFTWEEVHKDAHLWEFGDSGSVLVMVNDEQPVNYVLFSTDEGTTWREYSFGSDKVRVKAIVTVPEDTSRRFILLGYYPHTPSISVAVHLDFTSLTRKQCEVNLDAPGNDDFELWSPSEQRSEQCLFGRQTLYHRRVRDRECVVGKQPKAEAKFVKNCVCTRADFECEFNYYMNDSGECVLFPGTSPLLDDDSCHNGEEFWYERTPYRKIPYSSCEGGDRLDHGPEHRCPGISGHGTFFWLMIVSLPFLFAGLAGVWYRRRSKRGSIRLPGPDPALRYATDSGALAVLASVPWFLFGVAGVAWEWMSSTLERTARPFRSRGGYRSIPVDEDAQILRFEDEE